MEPIKVRLRSLVKPKSSGSNRCGYFGWLMMFFNKAMRALKIDCAKFRNYLGMPTSAVR